MSESRRVVIFEDLGTMEYKQAWDYQERLLKRNVDIKLCSTAEEGGVAGNFDEVFTQNFSPFC